MTWGTLVGFVTGRWKMVVTATVVLVVGYYTLQTIRYIQNSTKAETVIELQENQVKKREKVDEAVRNAPDNVLDSLRYLENRSN